MYRVDFRFFAVFCACLWMIGCETRNEPPADPTPTSRPPQTAVPTPLPTETPPVKPTFETADCQFPLPAELTVRCGYLTVPENREYPGRIIRLHVAVIASRSSTPAPDPVVYLNGGPGLHTLAAVEYFADSFADVLNERDLILYDQRGVGYSEPALDCPEMEDVRLANIEKELEPADRQALLLAALTACRDRLTASGIDLSAYNSAASAADLDDLRQALGYESWNLLGVSYGTRLALTAMRDYGRSGTIRSAILDSVYPPQIDSWATAGPNTSRTFELLFDRCAADNGCSSAFPALKTRFYALVDALNEEPTTVVVTDKVNRTTYRLPFDGDDLINTAFAMMYDANQIKYLPRMIIHLEQGRKTFLADWLTDNLRTLNSLGMSLSVQCGEEIPFNSEAALEESFNSLLPQLAHLIETELERETAFCDVWQVQTAAPLENEPVISDIPTLVLAGDYDPITPPAFGRETADFLNHSYFFELEGQSHGVIGSSSCGLELATAFLNQPDAPPDGACLERSFFGFVTQ